MRWHPWRMAAVAGVLAGVGYFLVDTELARETLWRVTLLGSCAAIVVGIRLNRPARSHPWWILLAALALITTANLLTYPLWILPWAQQVADLLSMVAFPLIGVAAMAIFRLQAPGGDRESAIDGLIVMVAMATVLIGTVFHPDMVDHGGSLTTLLLNSVVAPVMMAAVAAATFRLLFVGSVRIPSAWFVVFAASAGLFGNTMRALTSSQGVYERGIWSDAFILLSYAAAGLSCLHPSSTQLTERVEECRARFTHARLLVLGVALLAAPTTLLLQSNPSRVLVVASIALSLLVLLRLAQLVVDRERSRQQLHRQALYDDLTGLPNRLLILDRLGHEVAATRRRGTFVAVMFIDLDEFKQVNDDHGHRAGDQLLAAVAERLTQTVRADDTVGRLAGDEFVVISQHDDPDDVHLLAGRVAGALSKPFDLEEATLVLSASVGLVVSDAHDVDAERILSQADAAMYEAKRRPGGGVATYDERLDDERRRRRRMELDLGAALDRNQLELVYQPLVRPAARDGQQVVGVEALLRWPHHDPPVPPCEFIPIAEASDLIVRIGDHVIEAACRQIAAWEPCLPPDLPFTLYVNLASRQLSDPQLPARVADAVAGAGIDPGHLGFEVAETSVLDERAIAIASELSRLGVRLALDDFGIGFSSIAHLKRLPLDLIKLDGSLVAGAVRQPEDRAIFGAVVAVARELGIEVLAEQVETEEQLRLVQRLGCGLVQGFLLAKPGPADAISLPFRSGSLGGALAARRASGSPPAAG